MSDFVPLPNNFSLSTNLDSNEADFSVTKHDVLVKLTRLNQTKANGPDGIPSWLLKENAELLSDPVNSSFFEFFDLEFFNSILNSSILLE